MPSNKINIDLTLSDTFFGHEFAHEFKGEYDLPGLAYSRSEGLIEEAATLIDGVATLELKALGNPVWRGELSSAGARTIDLALGSGRLYGTITLS